MAYTTEEKIEKFLNTSITSGDADNFIDQAEKIINNLTGRNFEADTTASTRRFIGTDKNTLLIDDCIEVTKVEKANDKWGESLTEIESDDYILVPRNYSSENIPIKGVYWKYGYFGTGGDAVENHRVTAKWGYSENAPDDIVFVATVIAAGLYSANRSVGSAKSEKIGNYSITYGDDKKWSSFDRAKEILQSYKKYVL